MTDLKAEVDQLRLELRRVSTKALRTQVDGIEAAHAALMADLGSNQVITIDTATTVVFDTVIDDDGDISYATGTGILTVTSAGWYILTTNIRTTGMTADLLVGITKNGTTTWLVRDQVINDSLGTDSGSVTTVAKLAASDTVRVRVYYDSGACSIRGAGNESLFSAARIK